MVKFNDIEYINRTDPYAPVGTDRLSVLKEASREASNLAHDYRWLVSEMREAIRRMNKIATATGVEMPTGTMDAELARLEAMYTEARATAEGALKTWQDAKTEEENN